MESSSSSSSLGLLAVNSHVTALIEAERLGSSLQLEMLEMERCANEILNGLGNHIGFLLLYAMGGIVLQSKAICWSRTVIMDDVTITFIVVLLLSASVPCAALADFSFFFLSSGVSSTSSFSSTSTSATFEGFTITSSTNDLLTMRL
ncbi:hypothetical protein K7X08_013875 [Anisodus acutangulus]|uniref:Uncharacterized protein n=1 Tax=Anisodus acutangulus TaxID=402998 RepID=A0A9Q1LPB2_9SOLA|nr:hypothetical protein K7X08_013875 [Anisodus acutangulus]